ncbi:MAG: hypothetical protein HRT99_03535 [Mycoplasmatales bacterium]|nr:hypothetical protein [Mycoplasmatales bacterium]
MNNKEHLIELSKSLKFKLKSEVEQDILILYDELDRKMKHMKLINTENIEPMTRMDDEPIHFLREDIPGPTLDKQIILNNAPNTFEDFISINRKGKND